ncbi:MAG: iron-containing alcohol dehydrogenase [Propionivibrio sp.]
MRSAPSIDSFAFARMPEVHFGAGMLNKLPTLLGGHGKRILLVTGSSSFRRSTHCERLMQALGVAGITVFQVSVGGEPSPAFVDATVARYRGEHLDWVVSVGGGSAVDAGKAISAMLPSGDSVVEYLECKDTRKHDGRKVPFVAIPTSSGTGAEATKNAVLSDIGRAGYKSSLRHDRFVPDIALVDPELTLSCPADVTAACGMDALTQLLESYVLTKSSPMTDALALSGLEHVAAGLLPSVENGAHDIEARSHMAYGALLSGITLANAGLGVVHGYAGPLGGFHTIPHGVVCGTLVGEATRVTIEALFNDAEKNRIALRKYAKAGSTLARRHPVSVQHDCDLLVRTLNDWIERTGIPRLGRYGLSAADLPAILDKSNGKNSPATLNREQMAAILRARL